MTLTTPSPATDAGSGDDAPRPRPPWLKLIAIGVAGLAVLAGAGWLGLQWLTPHPYSGTVMQAPTAAPSMDGLFFSDGTPVEVDEFEGDLLLVYFGYTACPDVCPTTLSQVAAARKLIGDDGDRVRLVMISIDPERDVLEDLDDYVEAFDPTFLGATGEVEAVERVAAQYGIFFAKGDPLGDGYAMDHTATLMGIDRDGHLRIVWPAQLDVERLAADLDELL